MARRSLCRGAHDRAHGARPRALLRVSVWVPLLLGDLLSWPLGSNVGFAAPRPAFEASNERFVERVRKRALDGLGVPLTSRRFSGDPDTILTPRFLFVRDNQLILPAPPWFSEDAYAVAFELARAAWYRTQPDRARTLLVLTTFREGGDALFYVPLANDIGGLGEGFPASIFDDTPGSSLEGYVWLGDLALLEAAGDDYFREAFIHEIAHRWSAYVRIADPNGGPPSDLLLGRQRMHWSFLADTAGSPMEGNAWVRRDDGLYVTAFDSPLALRFSPLDLYLMGVLPPERVRPFQVITEWTVVDPARLSVAPSTEPAHRTGMHIALDARATEVITIEHVIAGSGPRTPPAVDVSPDSPLRWPIGVVLLSNGLTTTSLETLAALDRRLEDLARAFHEATGGRVVLDLTLEGAGTRPFGSPCSDLSVCDRSFSNRCAAIGARSATHCTRTCETDAECGLGFCCVLPEEPGTTPPAAITARLCTPSERCDSTKAAQGDRESEEVRPPPPDLDAPDATDPLARVSGRGCGCATAVPSRERTPKILMIDAALLLLAALARIVSPIRRPGRDMSRLCMAAGGRTNLSRTSSRAR